MKKALFVMIRNIGGSFAGAPLWNRNNSPASYVMYPADKLSGAIAGSPNEESLICLSCHDGALALNSMANPPGDGTAALPAMTGGDATRLNADGTLAATGYTYIGSDLTDDHPVSVAFDGTGHGWQALVDIEASRVKLFGDDNTVECASCHYAHGNTRGSFLRMSNAGSALCLSCHDR